MSFLCGVAGLSLRDRVRSSDIWEELRVEPLLLRGERSHAETAASATRTRVSGRRRDETRQYFYVTLYL